MVDELTFSPIVRPFSSIGNSIDRQEPKKDELLPMISRYSVKDT